MGVVHLMIVSISVQLSLLDVKEEIVVLNSSELSRLFAPIIFMSLNLRLVQQQIFISEMYSEVRTFLFFH